ncbi:5-formyltetrahydrofolate cyclo-ligase [Phenylobacterium sp.]|uniref:5-formyltetrahydrofolate cyclo-ligase n=1 Tax=Phenylobacterium sp. TaxID=1871053 RepID=UPI0025FD4884|nr:5-formyltetrahydrofolate cyclo-ligase [Phenylobacterium sp.]
MDSISDKATLRRSLRALRRRLAAERPDAGDRAAAVLAAAAPPRAKTYALYHPVGSELDPTPIRLDGARRSLPVAQARDGALVFRLHDPGDPLAPDALGIPSPIAEAAAVLPDIVFAPVLAFDRKGGRLGQGGGHYDRTIAALRAEKPVFVIGVAYAGQELPEIPMEPHDQRLDAILTETEYIQVG